MLKWYRLTTSLTVVFTLVAASATFSTPLSPASRSPQVDNSQVEQPLCYMQVADGTTIDLQKLCGKNSPAKSNLGSRHAKFQFRQGTGKAYATDSQPEKRDK